MVELRTLHLTDIHDDWEKYEVIAQYVAGKKNSEQAVDAVFITGDFIEGDFKIKGKTAQKVLEEIELLSKDKGKEEEEKFKAFVEKHQTEGKIDVENLDDAAKKELNDLGARMDALVSETIKKTVSESLPKTCRSY